MVGLVGQFSLDGASYQLAVNNGPNHLHGGLKAWDKLMWAAEATVTPEGPSVCFTLSSPAGEEGYPGNVEADG